jgi:PAS domain S-box-containing protein
MLDSIDDGYYEVDLAGNFTFFNDFLPKFMGYSPEELMGINYRILMDDTQTEKVFQVFSIRSTGRASRQGSWNGKTSQRTASLFMSSPLYS